jgi:transcription initiation factor IIE alpha subunit
MKKEKIEELKRLIEAQKEKIDTYEIDPDEYEESYCEAMDEQGEISISGLTFAPSRIVKELDPVAYRCGLVDYVDSIDVDESEEYQALKEELEDLENELEELEEEE